MKWFLIGSKELSVRVLEALVDSGEEVTGVLSRDREESMSVWLEKMGHRSLEKRARELDIDVYSGISVNSHEMEETLSDMDLDLIISVFWGEMFKERVLNIPRLGSFNIHIADLPRHRGSFPLAWAIIEGDRHAGATIHKMTMGPDNGPIVDQTRVPISDNETGESIYGKVIDAADHLFKKNIERFADMNYSLKLQDESSSSYHPRGYPHGGQINPNWDNGKVERFRRALHFPPFNGAVDPPPAVMKEAPDVHMALGVKLSYPDPSSDCSTWFRKPDDTIRNGLESFQDIAHTTFINGQYMSIMKGANNLPAHLLEKWDTGEILYSGRPISPGEEHILEPPCPREFGRELELSREALASCIGYDPEQRGLLTAYGKKGGLEGDYPMLDRLKRNGFSYLVSDLSDGTGQPYRYMNGLLEVPTRRIEDRKDMAGIFRTIHRLREKANETGRDRFTGLVLDMNELDDPGTISDLLNNEDIDTITFSQLCEHWNQPFRHN